MTLQLNALSSTFAVAPVAQRKQEAKLKAWQAVFFTLRSLCWEASKSKIFKDAIQNELLVPLAPGKRLADGTWSRPEYDQDDIKAVYSEAWTEFETQFDLAFAKATREEMLAYAQSRFEMTEAAILELNRQRTAERFNRLSEQRYH
ncbi:MAG: hypothetical protein AAFY57_20365 [Cyanobacteria bacterium J06642_2]